MEGFGNVLNEEQLNALFEEGATQDTPPENKEGEKQNNNVTTEVNGGKRVIDAADINQYFDNTDNGPEGVGSGEGKENTQAAKGTASPVNYSSTARYFAELGIFPNLSEDDINNIKDAQGFVDAMQKSIASQVNERNQRADRALGYGVEQNEIQQYEGMLNYLDSLKESQYLGDTDEAKNLRQQIIYQDFINRGFDKDDAVEFTKRSIYAGKDSEDVVKALKSNRDFYAKQYDSVVDSARKKQEEKVAERKAKAEKLRKDIMEEKNFFGNLEIDEATRKKVYDNITTPVYRDSDTGEYYTAIQKYEMEHPEDFRKNLGLIFTLTDGFKSLDKLIKTNVNKETKKKINSLEQALSGVRTNGNSSYAGSDDDSDFTGIARYGY